MATDSAYFCNTVALTQPVDLLAALRGCDELPIFYWEHPSREFAIAAAGAIAEFRASGAHRFREISTRVSEFFARLPKHDIDVGPLAVGGFGFSDQDCAAYEWREFPAAWFFVPRALWIRRGSQFTFAKIADTSANGCEKPLAFRARSARSGSGVAVPQSMHAPQPLAGERDRWRERVERASAMIAARPKCYNFWIRRGASSFIGSTPELLIRLEGGDLASDALAGSAARGSSREEDRALGDSLLHSAKNLEEHAYVVNHVRSALQAVAALGPAEPPRLMRLPEVQHLFSPITGKLRAKLSAFELAGLIHPTPAVCGVPRDEAGAILEREEPHRGWYTGAVGWMDAEGAGELAVALRSGLIEGNRMLVCAGSGIVAGSDPEAEFAETETKFNAMLRSAKVGSAT
jgi:isochorismate synthase EntC